MVQKLYQEKSNLSLKKAEIELGISRQSLIDLDALRPHFKAVLMAIRKDLDLPLEESWLNELSDTNSKEIINAVGSFHGKIEKMLADAKTVKTNP